MRFFNFKHQVLGIIIGNILKLSIVGWLDNSVLAVDGICRYFILDLFLLYTFYSFGKNERKAFQAFYEYREGLTKFKELLSDYLPQSMTILNAEATHTVFFNKTFSKIFENPQKPKRETPAISESNLRGSETQSEFCEQKIDLDSLEIDMNTIRGLGTTSPSLDFKGVQPNLKDIIKTLTKNVSLGENAWTLCASYSHCHFRKLFEIILKMIKWDKEDAVAVIFNDITHQENLISLKVADENKNKILGTVSHELRTPLNVIIGILQICERKIENNPDVLEHLELCKDNAYLLLSLVNSLLDLQRIGQGKFTLNPSKIELRKVLNDIVRLFQFQAKKSGVNLRLDIEDGLPEYIMNDENRLKQILINLLGNAFKFTFEGSITLKVSQDSINQDYLLFSVIDTGIGIKDEDKDKLFKMYGKLEDKEGVNKNGVGLGLTIANGLSAAISEKVDGRGIELESKFGVGSTFSFHALKNLSVQPKGEDSHKEIRDKMKERSGRLKNNGNVYYTQTLTGLENITENDSEELQPFTNFRTKIRNYTMVKKSIKEFESQDAMKESLTFEDKRLNQSIHSRENFEPNLEKENNINLAQIQTNVSNHILIVDDNHFNLLVAENLLRELGFVIKTARGGKEAIEIVRSFAQENQQFKVILMDCQMPIMDGYEATTILKEMMEKNEIKKTPIIALTANTGQRDMERCYESGMDDFLSKPLSKSELSEILKRLD